MNILIVNNSKIPVHLYGGTERVIWDLGKELVKLNCKVSYLVKRGSSCEFADVIAIDDSKEIIDQIPDEVDLVHFHFTPKHLDRVRKPYIITIHGNSNEEAFLYDQNTVFVSKNHAWRYQSDSFVYNGLDWNEYSKPNFNLERKYFHFLAKAAWRVKNVQGAIDTILRVKGASLHVLGGTRLNFSMGFRFTLNPRIHFHGMVGGKQKWDLLSASKGLIFPVIMYEPFGLALIESLYYGCPVFGTTHGSLPELITSEFGYLSNDSEELSKAIQETSQFDKRRCHDYALTCFNSEIMAKSYLEKYQQVVNGNKLNANPPKLRQKQTTNFLEWTK
ncbi:MAG: glycosyltransferase [Saprospiraceae bacterium]|nr:glycosyltransferase [Saprospiraceae bacterium]